jgi:hypothetical protein
MVVTLLLLSLQLPLSLLPLLSLLLLSLLLLSLLLLLSAAAGAARILEAKLGAVELQLPLSLLLLSLLLLSLLLLLSAATGAAVMMERACRPICPTWVNRPNPMAASRPTARISA